MAIRLKFAQREEHVHGPDHVVHLREDRVLAVDHGIRRGALLSEVNHRFRFKRLDSRGQKFVVGYIADEQLDRLARKLLPDSEPL